MSKLFSKLNKKNNKYKCTYELKNESCFDYLKGINNNSIDLVLIDPPYEISKETGFSSGKEKGNNTDRFRISMSFGKWDYNFSNLNIVIDECYRVLKNSGTLICFYDLWKITTLKNYLESSNFKQLRFIEWIKTNPVPINSKINYLTNSREIAITAVKNNKPVFNSEYDNGVYKYPINHDKGRFHPTQKPENLITDLILKHSNINDIVLDCFSGSGTTAVCCMNNGRNFKGCEIDTNYYLKSMERLKNLKRNGIEFE
jgi:DNA modification methylase